MSAEIIPVDFSPSFFDLVASAVSQLGAPGAVQFLISNGEHPSFARVIVKRIVRSRVAR